MRPAVATEPAAVHRPLSPLERWYWICDQVSPLNVISHARVRGPVPAELLARALTALQRRHPLLRAAIEADTDGANPRFVPAAGPIPLRELTVVGDDAETAWERELEERELVEPVDWRGGPLARAVVLTRAAGDGEPVRDLLLTLPHCVADGTTVLTLMRQWIELAADLDTGADHEPGEPVRALPPPEGLRPPRHRGPAGAARVAAQLLRDQGGAALRRPRRVEPDVRVPFARRRTRLLHRSLTAGQLDAVVRACRRENTTVHGLLAAAVVTAVARDAGVTGRFTVGSPIDVRGELVPPVSDREMGTYVATVPSVVDCRPGRPLWPAARAISRDLARRRRRGEPLSSINLLRWAAPKTVAGSGRFLRFMDEKGPINLCVSNVGRYDFPGLIGRWRVSCAEFVASLSVNGLFIATINSSHDRLAWNFTYVQDAVGDERARRLADGAVAAVLGAAGTEASARGRERSDRAG